MKYAILASALVFSGSAQAHDGVHMHPHGMDGVWMLAGVAALLSAAAYYAWGRK